MDQILTQLLAFEKEVYLGPIFNSTTYIYTYRERDIVCVRACAIKNDERGREHGIERGRSREIQAMIEICADMNTEIKREEHGTTTDADRESDNQDGQRMMSMQTELTDQRDVNMLVDSTELAASNITINVPGLQ